MVRSKRLNIWSLPAVLLGIALAACGGSSTAVGVTVTAAGVTSGATATVIENQTLQLNATVSGITAGTVYWQICLPAINITTQPTTCTQIPGVTSNPTKTTTTLTGYGTVTQTGLYTAPPAPPSPNSFVVMASSQVNAQAFGILNMQIDSGVRVQLIPSSITLPSGEFYNFTASVTGSSNTAISWQASSASSGTVAGGNAQIGTISPSGQYVAPATAAALTVTLTAISSADPSKTATATVNVIPPSDPQVTNIVPTQAAQGSAQQDVYLNGQNFATNDTVIVTPPGQATTSVTTTFVSANLLRATIPSNLLTQTGQVAIQVERQNGSLNTPGPFNLTVSSVRPALVAVSPDNVSQNSTSTSVNLTGGYFSPAATTVQFDGSSTGITPTFTNSRQLTFNTPVGAAAVPGLYPITVKNSGIAAGQPSSASINLSVTPLPSSIGTAPSTTPIGVGVDPVAVAIDYASETALVANYGNGTSAGSVSVINLAANPPVLVNTIPVGKGPTGVAVDDLLSPHVALVVNSVDQTVSAINLTTQTVASTVSVAVGPPSGSNANTAPVPYSVGINPLTDRAVVAYQSFNEATILDVALIYAGSASGVIGQVGGNPLASVGTGSAPQIAVDPEVNWAVITPGGSGLSTTNIVDLGRGDLNRAPAVVASFALASAGVAIDSETHEALLTDANTGFTSFSLLDNSVNSITFTQNGVPVSLINYESVAVDSLTGVAVAVGNTGEATVLNLESGIVLQTAILSGTAEAVAVDPYSNQAVVVNQSAGAGSVSILSLGNAINPVQIVESSPSIALTSATTPLAFTITGGGFSGVSQVLLDGTALPAGSVSVLNTRQIVATVPANMLASARNYAVQVQTGASPSNARDLTIIQPVSVGTSPVGVAVDNDRDLAVVTNSGSNTVSLVALSPTTPVGMTQVPAGAVGTVGQPISVGSAPLGVAVIPRLGLAVVANSSSNNVSLIDITQTFPSQTVSGCAGGTTCTGQSGVAIDQDSAIAVVANSTTNNNIANNTSNNISYITLTGPTTSGTTTTAGSLTVSQTLTSDLNPTAIAIDPVVNPANPTGGGYAAVTSASQSSSLLLFTLPGANAIERITGYQVPTDVRFDPVNQVFLVANSLVNQISILNPSSFTQNSVDAGINPASLDYNFQTSTLATVNKISNTLSVLDYVCPPVIGTVNSCPTPQVLEVLDVGGSQQFSVAVDLKLNLAVVADQNNNRVLLVPLPH